MSVAILITARLKSTRLREKAIKQIMGRPMLSHMIDRLKLAKKPNKIIVCTSTIEQDNRLCELAESEGVEYFRGHPEDVLMRMRDAAKKFDVDTVISCTADNPFIDPIYVDKIIDFHLNNNNDFSYIEGLPFGTFSYALKYNAIVKACEIKDTIDTEVWGGYFTQTDMFKCDFLKVTDQSVKYPELRLTVDTLQDFNLIVEIFKQLDGSNNVFSLKEIVALCREDEQLMNININIVQKEAKPIALK